MNSLIETLYTLHIDNTNNQYFASSGGKNKSMMPTTPFIHEYFLYNSLYQIDWKNSQVTNELIYHDIELSEFKQQKSFIRYLKEKARETPRLLYRALEPISYISEIDSDWTNIYPGTRLSEDDGKNFFVKIEYIKQTILKFQKDQDSFPVTNDFFKQIEKCLFFIYMVRNNIFHGVKSISDINNSKQKKRIQVYETFLKGITSLFFLINGKHKVASDILPLSLPKFLSNNLRDPEKLIYKTIGKNQMKLGDTRLIMQSYSLMESEIQITPGEKSALFYPSCGTDYFTPILIGLLSCRQFFFYDRMRNRRRNDILTFLSSLDPTKRQFVFKENEKDVMQIDFMFNAIKRSIYILNKDNTDIFNQDIQLKFYFHRGDSWGEGGSGQQWDSELLSGLINKTNNDEPCYFLTDGQPGGVDKEKVREINTLTLPFIERGRFYYFGKL
jgi:hypothetical protein